MPIFKTAIKETRAELKKYYLSKASASELVDYGRNGL